jgi:transposase
MRKIKEVLRLRFELGLGQREIARAYSISQGAVHNYLKRAAGAGMQWPLPEGWDEKRIEEAVFGKQRSIEQSSPRAFPDFPALHDQLQQHPHLTLQLAWEEYREKNPEGYRYSRFCELYQQWRRKQDVVLRQEHKAGEKGFVDWAGATMPVHDPDTGGIWQASLFVMVLGASSYTYAEATRDQQLTAWIGSHIHAFEYFGGTPRLLVPDNPRTGVSRACRYDPDLNPTYQEMAIQRQTIQEAQLPCRLILFLPLDGFDHPVQSECVQFFFRRLLEHRSDPLTEVSGAPDVVVSGRGRKRGLFGQRLLVQRVLQDRFHTLVAVGAGPQRSIRRRFHPSHRILCGEPDDS